MRSHQTVAEPSFRTGGYRPPVILLGGAPGTGKTTIANLLLNELGLSHHLSTGFIRSSVAPMLPEADARLLDYHTYDAYQALEGTTTTGGTAVGNNRDLVLEGALRQSMLLKPAIESCISRAFQEGIGIVVEGSHFMPGVIESASLGAALLCILDVPDREALKLRVHSPSHSRRRLSDDQLDRVIQLQEGILGLAQVHQQPVIINDDLTRAVKEIRGLVGR